MMAHPIVVSSPLRGNYVYNLDKAADVCCDLIDLGYAPIATHLFYMKANLLNDRIDSHRSIGIVHTLAWIKLVGRVLFVTKEDGRFSEGCQKEFEFAKKNCIPYVIIPWNYTHEKLIAAITSLEEMVEVWAA